MGIETSCCHNQDNPRVSIVTPSYNQAQFLEETILSVLNQDYPNIEYIVIDGGSTDGSVDIIKRYEDRLAYWVSEPDRGQSHAINKGWQRATGDIVAYLNSDDLYTPGAIRVAVQALLSHPDVCMVYSDAWRIDEHGRFLGRLKGGPFDTRRVITTQVAMHQPTVFIRRSALAMVGLLDEQLHMTMDYDLWIRLGVYYPAAYMPGVCLAKMREHAAAKSTTLIGRFALERRKVLDKLFARDDVPDELIRFRRHAYASVSFGQAIVAAHSGEPQHIRQPLFRAVVESPVYVARRPFTLCLIARMLMPWWTGRSSAVSGA